MIHFKPRVSNLKTRAQNSKLIFLGVIGILIFGAVAFFRFTTFGASFLWDISNEGKWMLPLVLAAALLDSINPCAFSILLVTIAFLFTLERMRTQIMAVGLAYIAGIFLVYLLIGFGILHALHLFNTPHFMAKLGAAALILWGAVNVVNEIFPAFPIKLGIPHTAHQRMAILMEKGSVPAAFLLGGLVGLCEFPCTGGPYLMVLGLLHDAATYLQGVAYLILYNFIFVLPLIVILLLASERRVVEKVEAWRKKESKVMRLGTGVAMMALGALIFLL